MGEDDLGGLAAQSDTAKPSHNQADNLSELMPAITELYKEWCRLKGHPLGKTPIEISIDTATGYEAARMTEFVSWLQLEVMSRLPQRLPQTGAKSE